MIIYIKAILNKEDRQYLKKWLPFQIVWLAVLFIITSGGHWFVILAAGITWLYWLSAWKDESQKSCIIKKGNRIIWEVRNEI